MLITHDCEFLDDGKTIELLSIGMVAENGDELYRVVEDADWEAAMAHGDGWVWKNVVEAHLPIALTGDEQVFEWDSTHGDFSSIARHEMVRTDVEQFLRAHGGPDDIDLWAYYPATDHVALYQLFGPMIECTDHGMPMRTSCLKQEEVQLERRLSKEVQGSRKLYDLMSKDFWAERPVQDEITEHHALFDARHDMALARWLGLA